jgi:hypothetical protein
VWLLQAASALDGLDPSAIILALAGVVTTLGGLLLRGWNERLKSETAERVKANEQLLQAKDALLQAKDQELARVCLERDQWRKRAEYLEDDRSKGKDVVIEAIKHLRVKSRTDSPPPTTYSMQTRTKTPL